MSEFAAVDVIRAKRDGGELSDAQIDWVVDADGGLTWAGEGEPPEGIPSRWPG